VAWMLPWLSPGTPATYCSALNPPAAARMRSLAQVL
jgi:hypothetical protein